MKGFEARIEDYGNRLVLRVGTGVPGEFKQVLIRARAGVVETSEALRMAAKMIDEFHAPIYEEPAQLGGIIDSFVGR